MTPARRGAGLLGLLAALGTIAGVGLAASPADNSVHSEAGLKLVFDDEFPGSRLDRSRWSTCYWWARRGCTIASNHELEWYLPGQVGLSGGAARLVAERRRVHGSDGRTYRFVSGMISSGPTPTRREAKFAFLYGRVEARMRVPAGAGLWSAFWMLPADQSDLPEIDIMETHGQTPSIVRMHLHYAGPGGGERVESPRWTLPSPATGWHRFGIDWRPGRLDWLIDGVSRGHVTGAAVPHVRMYLIANLAVGGDPIGPPNRLTRFPSALAIDWVRVWQ